MPRAHWRVVQSPLRCHVQYARSVQRRGDLCRLGGSRRRPNASLRALVWALVLLSLSGWGSGWLGGDVSAAPHSLELWQSGRAWSVAGVQPGEPAFIPNVAHLTVISPDVWSLSLQADLEAEDGRPIRSEVRPVLISRDVGPSGPASSFTQVGALVTLSDQEPTGVDGRQIRVDLALSPSWDDPPDLPLHARLRLALSGAGRIHAAYVTPHRFTQGSVEAVSIWFRGSMDDVGKQEGGIPRDKRSPHPEDLTLVISKDGAPAGTPTRAQVVGVTQDGWQQVMVSNAGSFTPGRYHYSLAASRGERIAMGTWEVLPSSGEGRRTTELAVHPLTQNKAAAPAEARIGGELEARIQVDSKRSRPGEPAEWLVRLFNPGMLSLLESALYVCLPSEWYVTAADHPRVKRAIDGRMCEVLLLGSLAGRTQHQVTFSLMEWPPPGPRLLRIERVPTAQLYLYARGSGEAEPMLVRSAEARLLTNEAGLTTELEVNGVAFIDRNGDGVAGSGESGVAGAEIVVNGATVRRSNRNGSFTLRLPSGSHLIWARSESGSSRPAWVDVHSGAPLSISLPIPSEGVDAVRRRDEVYLEAELLAPPASTLGTTRERQRTAHRIRATHLGPVAQLDWGTDSVGGDARLQLRGEGHTWEANWRQGVPERIRLGALRPSLPVASAWTLGLDVPPHAIPGSESAVASVGMQLGEAGGDFWGCRTLWTGVDWSAGTTRLSADMTRSTHVRQDERGERRDQAGHVRLEGTGGSTTTEGGWRTSYALYAGNPREFSPSCGETPRDGHHGSLNLHPPQVGPRAPAIEAATIAASRWSSGAQAVELGVASARVAPSGESDLALTARSPLSFQFVPAVQWLKERGELDEVKTRPGLIVRTWAGRHRLEAQFGHRPLQEAKRELDVERGDGRRSLAWRWDGGRLNLSASFDAYDGDEGRERIGEVGLSLRNPIPPQLLAGLSSSRVELSRSLSLTRLRDDLRFDARILGHDVRLRINGREPRDPQDSLHLYWGRYDTVQLSGRVKGRLGSASTSEEGVDWSVEVGRLDSWEEQERSVALSLEGEWRLGKWRTSFDRRMERGSLASYKGRQAWTVQATCSCGDWSVEADLRRLTRFVAPWQSVAAAPGAAAARVHASRPVARGLYGYAEILWSEIERADGSAGGMVPVPGVGGWTGMGQDPRDGSARSTLSVGLEWQPPLESLPLRIGIGIESDIGERWEDERGSRLVARARIPIFTNQFAGADNGDDGAPKKGVRPNNEESR